MSAGSPSCPECGGALEGLARFCWACGDYVDRLGTPSAAPEARRSPPIEDGRLESEIQLGIRSALELLGFHVSDLSQDRPTRQTPGIPDLFVMGGSRFTWAEVKRPRKGRLSDGQREWHGRARENGVPLEVWTSEADAIAWATRDGR